MKRLYMMPNSSLRVLGPGGEFLGWQKIQTGLDYSTNPPAPVMTEVAGLFARGEHHAVHLGNDMLLIIASFDDERHEDWFHGHPDVAILPHPTIDGNTPLPAHIGKEGYKFTPPHWDLIKGHPLIGATDADTVLSLQKKISSFNSNFKLRNAL